MYRHSSRRRSHSRPDNGIYDGLILSGMDIPESVDTQKKAQENHSKMAETPVPSLIWSLSVSTIFTMLVATTYNIVDTYFVSDLGESSVAAVGIMFSVMALIQAVGYTWGMGAGSEIARLLGKQKKREAEQTLATALSGGILSGGIMAVIFAVFRGSVVRLLGATDTSLAPAEQYGIYIMLAAPVMCGAYVLNNALRAEGQPYLALLGILAGGLSNALFDYILVRVLELGIAGAGIATLVGQGISLVIMYICVRSRFSVIRLHVSDMWGLRYGMRIVRTGLPSFLRQGLMCLAAVMISRNCRQYGDGAMAGITVANKIFAVIFAVLVGYGQGFAPVCGFAYGAGLASRVKRSLRFTMITAVIFMCAMGVVTWVWASGLAGVFLQDGGTQSLQLAALSLRAHAVSMPFAAVCLVTGMYYQALGAYGKATLISALRQGVCFIPLVFILPHMYGVDGVAYVQAAADVLSGLVALVFYMVMCVSSRKNHTQMRNSLS